MKLIRTDKSGPVFYLGQREKQLLLDTVARYPLVPAAHYRLSKKAQGANAEDNQRWLEAALDEQRQENRRQALEMLTASQRFRPVKSGFELTLTPAQIEWLLQVLNDVRVGSWLALGQPEPGQQPEFTEQNLKHLVTMEVCGAFESGLLAALGVRESPNWARE